MPASALDTLADQANVPRIDELHCNTGAGVFDETIRHLGLSLLPALRAPSHASRLFTDYVALASATHVAQAYDGMQMVCNPIKGGLAPWLERRSKEMIGGDLSGATPLRKIADACGLSVSHFSRAFRRSSSLSPHAWLLDTRVEAAKAMLRTGHVSLSAIALACGFADRSHLARVFSRRVGVSPAAWRRMVTELPSTPEA